jgi:3-deoxy-D-manno-octulosonic-acid transferase
VGEVLSAAALIVELRERRSHLRVYVSTTTLAGRDTAEKQLGRIADGVFFAPLDYRSAVRRVLRRLRPALVVILETEIWPNLYRESKRAGASLVVVNGRISDRALPQYRRWRGVFRHVLRWPDAVLTQTEEDARRFIAAGARTEIVRAAGNLKYDFKPPASGIAPEIAEFLDRVNPRRVWIAASTMPPTYGGDIDEDDAVIAAMSELDDVFLIVAPRKPERFDVVAQKLERAGIRFARRTKIDALDAPVEPPRALLLDSIGDLAALFERADVVFMGGTLADRGGHNILEPAFFAKPIIVGPHMENFAAIAAEFNLAEALTSIGRADELGDAVARLLNDTPGTGERARTLALSKRGVAARIADDLLQAYSEGVPDPTRTLAARVALTPLSWIWRAGHAIHRAVTNPRKLATPVISVGALSIGGAGKSPMVAHLARRLSERGRNLAILTRGYKRQSSEPVIVARGESAGIDRTGDEAQVYVRDGDAHVGIGAGRFAIARRMEAELAPGVFLLDDGFQHFQLARNHNIVLMDAMDPLGGGVIPLGRLREPVSALARADIVVVTRTDKGQNIGGIRNLVARYNPQAAVFASRVVPMHFVDAATGEIRAVPKGSVAAFCGLAVPRTFWRTLEELGIQPAVRRAFDDHHRYAPSELKSLAASGAETLVTTEKDAMNLCEGAAQLVAPCALLWLKIGIEIDGEEELLNRIL